MLRVGQLGRQLPRLPLAPQHRVGGIGSLRLAEHLPDPRLQLSQCRLDSFRRPGVKAAGVGLHPCAIEGDFHQLDQPDRHRQPANVLEQLLQRLLELRAEFAQGSVVDRAPLGQPHEVDVVATGVFQLPARSDTPHQPIEDHARHHPWRNRRLPQAAIVLLLPGRPVFGAKDLVQQPHGMVVADQTVQGRREQVDLFTSHRSLCPVIHGSIPFRIPANCSLPSSMETIPYADNSDTFSNVWKLRVIRLLRGFRWTVLT